MSRSGPKRHQDELFTENEWTVPQLVTEVEKAIDEQVAIVAELDDVASKHPYYKYNSKWARAIQNAIGTTVYCAWLGGLGTESQPAELGCLLTLEQVGAIFKGEASSYASSSHTRRLTVFSAHQP